MGISINAPGSVNSQASMTGTLSIRKSTNTFEQVAGVSSSGGTSKKQLNYNHRDISGSAAPGEEAAECIRGADPCKEQGVYASACGGIRTV